MNEEGDQNKDHVCCAFLTGLWSWPCILI